MPPLNVVALNAEPVAVPENVKPLTEGEETRFTVGLLAVPPVVIFVPGCTFVWETEPIVEKIEYKFVLPLNIVPPLNVVALNAEPVAVPENVKSLIEGEVTRFIVGLLAVPPVVILDPGCTFVWEIEPIGEKIEYKFVLPLNIVPPLNVVALNEAPLAIPEKLNPFKEGEATRFTVGLLAVPPVVIFVPGCTFVWETEPIVEKIEYKFVLPLNIVPPLNVVALNTEPIAVPENINPLIEGDETRFIVGLLAVPPVVILVPGCTFVWETEPTVENIEYKFVLPLNIVSPLNVVALNDGEFIFPVNVAPDKFALVVSCELIKDTFPTVANNAPTLVFPE